MQDSSRTFEDVPPIVVGLSLNVRELGSAALDALVMVAAAACAIGLGSEVSPLSGGIPSLVALTIGLHLLLLWNRGIYSLESRYIGFHDAVLIGLAGLPSALAMGVGDYLLKITTLRFGPVLTILLYALVATNGLLAIRVARRYSHRVRQDAARKSGAKKRVLVVGAGDAGEMFVRELVKSRESCAMVVGFVDDDPAKRNLKIHGVPVLGRIADIVSLVHDHAIGEIVIAIPAATGDQMRKIHNLCRRVFVPVRTLPSVSKLFTQGAKLSSQLRQISIEDLLRRAPVETDTDGIGEYIGGEHVLVTGGGGSIGSELARQIALLNPATIILVGKGENSLYEIEQELIHAQGLAPVVIVADVRDEESMETVFRDHRPTVVFHAAAHKHVPLMQRNVREAIRNNIIGTLVMAQLAVRYGVAKFILISTDKAVRPSSVMGATKRVCEMLVTAMAQTSETQFAAVRFGNVLGSRGSLVPLLESQIKRGGPVTVTHPEMTRFFMTIPEAVQLVLQAGALGGRGEIFILDMGEAIKIDDLARELIWLHGLVPEQDIEIRYTGVRPGEKLHEELVYDSNDLKGTTHPKISMVENGSGAGPQALKAAIAQLVELTHQEEPDHARQMLMDLAWNKHNLNLLSPYMG